MSEVFAITLRKVVNFSLKAKHLEIKPEGVGKLFLFIFLLLSTLLTSASAYGQVENPISAPDRTLPMISDSIPARPDSLLNKNDTLNVKPDSVVAPVPKSDIETTIFYSARDSINSSLESKIIKLYGEAKITYGEIQLEADEIIIDYEKSTITAKGSVDSLGQRVGYPIFKNGPEVYETRDMVYNFKTKRAKISEVVTQQGDGFMHGDVVYKNDKNELFTIGNAYTTCNLSHPHFRIISKKAKAIPHDKIVTGPFYMELNDVPLPLGFLFGMFPAQKESASGIIVPSYGEEARRGFFLRNGGYFFDINDYIKMGLTGDIYSEGSNAVYLNSIYRKRYAYNGSFNFSITNNRLTDDIEDDSKTTDFRIAWSHSPQTKGTGRFSASVNVLTSNYTNNNFLGLNNDPRSTRPDNTSRKLSSNVSYSKTFPGTPMSLGVNMRVNQDLVTKRIDLPLPDMSFNVNNIYPFKQSNVEFLENFVVKYTANGSNQVTNSLGKIGDVNDSIVPFTVDNLSLFFKNSRKGIRHSIPISTSVKALKHFTMSPSINYNEIWYFEKLDWGLDNTGNNVVVIDTLNGFSRITNYSMTFNLNTRLYGMFISKNPDSRIKAIRHVINPSIGFGFQPDFGDPSFGYYQEVTTGNGTVVRKSRHEGPQFIYGSSSQTKQSAMSFSLGNNFEMKVKNKDDSVARKVSLLNNLAISTSYNFAADSFKLAPFSFTANANILNDKFNINIGGILDPYQYRIDSVGTSEGNTGQVYETKISRFVWQDGFALGQVTSLNLALGTNLSPKGVNKDAETRNKIAQSDLSESDKEFFMQNPDIYLDFSIPWNLRINYNLNYNKQGSQTSQFTQTLRFNGDLSLTEKWKVTFNSGYDFESKEFTQTYLTINRDLHCWQLSLGWTPFGPFQSYNFSIGVKSGLLRDLKMDRTRNFFDAR
ncbi:MAG: putative LPS assembly protein LptD [Cyclobacteriaceae bacterium]|nr:putative LPS assembly protein LptD [Cyclobacteriaceae bacterium]